MPMAQEGVPGRALVAERAVLAARDGALADADRVLTEILAAAHAVAVESIARIETLRAEIDAAAGQSTNSPAGAHELSTLLVAKQREIAEILEEARAASESKTAVLQHLTGHYRSALGGLTADPQR